MNYDVIIIGAGVNGAGIARDAARRGLRVLLLDKGDICAGTSAWSTRLIHGGLRYLEYGEIGLVRESLREREILLHIAPHLVKPLAMVVPLYDEPQRRGRWTMRAGMLAYDALSFDKSLEHHHFWSRRETLQHAPALRADKLTGAAVYFDAQVTYPERLVLENVLDAVTHGAELRTYARVTRLLTHDGVTQGVEFTDADGATHTAHAPVVFNVAGPWVDEVLRDELTPNAKPFIGGTKGSHIVVRPLAGTPDGAIYVEARSDGRPFFIIPWQGLCLIGTTDMPYHGDLDAVTADESEIRYLLDETNWLLPDANLRRADVLYTYSGVRPLPYQDASTPAGITRRHFIQHHTRRQNGLFSIIGGKLTTYRSLAEEATDAAISYAPFAATPCDTADARLPGADAENLAHFAGDFVANDDILPRNVRARLVSIYGTRANALLALAATDAMLREVIDAETNAIAAEIVFAFRAEHATTLSDALLRRTMLGLAAHAGIGPDERAAHLAQQFLGWSQERATEEVMAYRALTDRTSSKSGV